MPFQLFLVHPRSRDDDDGRVQIAELVVARGGFVLMTTSYGSMVTSFYDTHLDAVRAHPLVEFVGGVTLDPNAPGAAALQRMFAENVAAQLVERGLVGPDGSVSSDAGFPPAYRPLRWPTPAPGGARPAPVLALGPDDDEREDD